MNDLWISINEIEKDFDEIYKQYNMTKQKIKYVNSIFKHIIKNSKKNNEWAIIRNEYKRIMLRLYDFLDEREIEQKEKIDAFGMEFKEGTERGEK